jgi:hypothetical protein
MLIRNSQPYVLLVLIGGLLIVGVAMAVLHSLVAYFYNASFSDVYLTDPVYQVFFRRMKTLWVVLPVTIGIGLFVWGLIKAHQREDGY